MQLLFYGNGQATITVTATSPTGTEKSMDFVITVNNPQTIDCSSLQATGQITNVLCNGDNTGKILVTASGGTAPYSYKWSNTRTDNGLYHVPAGFYTVVIVDSNKCAI